MEIQFFGSVSEFSVILKDRLLWVLLGLLLLHSGAQLTDLWH